jgi:hypothetical protein
MQNKTRQANLENHGPNAAFSKAKIKAESVQTPPREDKNYRSVSRTVIYLYHIYHLPAAHQALLSVLNAA